VSFEILVLGFTLFILFYFHNSLACVRLGSTVSIGQNIQSIFMFSDFVGAGENVQISGWGATENDKGENSNDLLILTKRTITNADCLAAYGSSIVDGHLCTTAITAGTGICTSDVGGPLILNANLVGIASWHPLPCGDARPDVYTRVSAFRSWITSVTSV
jgi:trypsin